MADLDCLVARADAALVLLTSTSRWERRSTSVSLSAHSASWRSAGFFRSSFLVLRFCVFSRYFSTTAGRAALERHVGRGSRPAADLCVLPPVVVGRRCRAPPSGRSHAAATPSRRPSWSSSSYRNFFVQFWSLRGLRSVVQSKSLGQCRARTHAQTPAGPALHDITPGRPCFGRRSRFNLGSVRQQSSSSCARERGLRAACSSHMPPPATRHAPSTRTR